MTENPYTAPAESDGAENRATSRMTTTATHQGFRNAALCAIVVFIVVGVVFWSLYTYTALPWALSLLSAFAILFSVSLVAMIVSWIRGMQLRGELIVDCGPHPGRRLFLTNAVMFLALGLSGFSFGVGAAIFMTLFAAYWLFMALGRFSVHHEGLWVYHALLPWRKISHYSWSRDNTLVLQTTGLFSWSRTAIPVPPECIDDVRRLLLQHKNEAT